MHILYLGDVFVLYISYLYTVYIILAYGYFAYMLHILYFCVTMMYHLFYDARVRTFNGSQVKDFVNR